MFLFTLNTDYSFGNNKIFFLFIAMRVYVLSMSMSGSSTKIGCNGKVNRVEVHFRSPLWFSSHVLQMCCRKLCGLYSVMFY